MTFTFLSFVISHLFSYAPRLSYYRQYGAIGSTLLEVSSSSTKMSIFIFGHFETDTHQMTCLELRRRRRRRRRNGRDDDLEWVNTGFVAEAGPYAAIVNMPNSDHLWITGTRIPNRYWDRSRFKSP